MGDLLQNLVYFDACKFFVQTTKFSVIISKFQNRSGNGDVSTGKLNSDEHSGNLGVKIITNLLE